MKKPKEFETLSWVQVLLVAFIRYEILKKVRFRQFESYDSKK